MSETNGISNHNIRALFGRAVHPSSNNIINETSIEMDEISMEMDDTIIPFHTGPRVLAANYPRYYSLVLILLREYELKRLVERSCFWLEHQEQERAHIPRLLDTREILLHLL